MIRLIFHIILLGILAAFVAINMPYTTTINLFGYMLEDVSSVAVVLVSLVIGVLYSFVYYVLSYFRKSGIKRAKKRQEVTKDREKELKEKQKQLESHPAESSAATTQPGGAAAGEGQGEEPLDQAEAAGKKKKGGLFGKRRNKG